MPEPFQGYPEVPNIDYSEAAGGPRKHRAPVPGFEGQSEDNLDLKSEALKASTHAKTTVSDPGNGK
jgi:hypothetical protein